MGKDFSPIPYEFVFIFFIEIILSCVFNTSHLIEYTAVKT